MFDIEEILREYETEKSGRTSWDSYWKECAELVLPNYDEFYRDGASDITSQRSRIDKIYDSTATISAATFATVVDSAVTPRNQKWQRIVSSNPDLMRINKVAKYFDNVTNVLFRMRYQSKSNFASQNHEKYVSLGVFGHGVMFIDEMVGQGLRYKSEYIGDVYIKENYAGIIDTIFVEYFLTARQAAQKFGQEKLGEKMKGALSSTPNQKFKFVFLVKPNEKYEIGGEYKKNKKKYKACSICVEDKMIVQEGGYRTFPFVIDRHLTTPRSCYAYSPAMLALGDIKMLNEMSRTDIIASQKMAQPPLLLSDDGVLTKVNTRPNALNIGGLDSNGNPMVRALETNSRPDIAEQKMEQRRESIRESFLVNIFRIMVDRPQATATEILESQKEKSALLIPILGRLTDSIGVQTERELDLAAQMGMLPEMPQELIEAQGDYEMVYDNELTRMQSAGEALGTQRQMQFAAELAQMTGDPSVLDQYDVDEVQRIIAQANAVPARAFLDERVVAEKRAARAKQMEMQQMLAAAPQVAGAYKDVKTADAASRP